MALNETINSNQRQVYKMGRVGKTLLILEFVSMLECSLSN